MKLATGETVNHDIYGEVQITGFVSVSDEVEVEEVDGELDPVFSVNGDKVEFLDNLGRSYSVPLSEFYNNIQGD